MKTKTIDKLKKMAFITYILGFFLFFVETYFFIFIITGYAFDNPESFIVSTCVAFGCSSILYFTLSLILCRIIRSKDGNILEEQKKCK